MIPNFGNWQAFLDELVAQFTKDGSLEQYKTYSSNFQRVAFLRNASILEKTSWITNYFAQCQNSTVEARKSSTQASTLRKTGNKHFQRKSYTEAIDFYTKCIKHAPSENPPDQESELALGFANRSAALYHQGLYRECLDDISRALGHGYSQNLQYKVLQRRGQCFYHIKLFKEANSALKEAAEVLQKATQMDAKRTAAVHKELESWITKVQDKIDGSHGEPVDPKHVQGVPRSVPPVCHGPNEVLVQATRSVDMRQNDAKGRHLVANSAIKAGDVLILERPYAAVLLPSHYDNHCHHCFSELVAPLPCDQCSEVSYCSEECKLASWTTYHSVECTYLDLLHSIGIAHLGLRIVLTAGLDLLMGFEEEYTQLCANRKEASAPGLTEDGKYERNYLSVFELMPHSDDMQTDDLLQYTLTATLLLKCLESSNFFRKITVDGVKSTDEDNKNLEDTKLYIGGLLLRHICQLVCNAHAITELKVTQDADFSLVETTSQVRVATAIYPTASLMNHSCDPTIISSFKDDTLIVRALKDVPAGGEIYNCYGPHCKRMNLPERLLCLKEQYFFDCVCDACAVDQDKACRIKALRCPECSGPLGFPQPSMTCADCGHTTEGADQIKAVLKSQTLFVQGLQQLENRNVPAAIEHLEQCLKMRSDVLYKHNKDLAEAQDALARCCAISGDFKRSAELLAASVKTTEVIHGSSSIELGTELQKYADILVNIRDIEKANEVVTRAVEIFTLNLGPDCSQVEELNEYSSMLRHLG